MSRTPPTFGTDPRLHGDVGWDDYCTLHRDPGGGLLYELKSVRRGILAELIRFVMLLPESERRAYTIEKPGDHQLDYREIANLAGRADFPG